MGEKYAESVVLDLERTWEESDPRTPLICFLSMGSDPTDSIIALGKRLKIETSYVSMGQGQEVHARKLLQHSMANVRPAKFCLFNIHTDVYGGHTLKTAGYFEDIVSQRFLSNSSKDMVTLVQRLI